MITNPAGKFRSLVSLCLEKLDTDMHNIAREQERLEAYKAKNPEKVLQINAWQELINSRADVNEYLKECISEHFPVLMEAEAARRFLNGRKAEQNYTAGGYTYYSSEQMKEAARQYSIAQQRLKDNI